ncbi:DUF4261 domain-containing protein [Winogradskyella thalassocola]|uniref:DUF4261 domain-containing protein n=1 Tax=Winogradskyella thalassocola TaxID=262004 RepID=A0A1G8M219_9FLAO|nr:DUF4261 domain-containing protein [Winogradskyella thalassocola]SDI61998.1 protein of unknown function [Winogradskyella thalassocola]
MKKSITLLLIGIISMGLFSFLKKEKKVETNTNSAILGMVLLEEPNAFDLKGTVNELRTKWKLNVDDHDADNKAAVLVIGDYNIAIANIPAAIPEGEVESTAKYNYFWKNGVEESSKHKGHIVLSIMNAGKNAVYENLLYSKIASAVMNNSKSLGIYIGGRTLVIKKDFYQANVEMMSEEDLPLYNWIYFGLRNENGKQSVYTYGLADFGKQEMEIVESDNSIEELNEMMFNLVHYVIAYNVVLKDGETIGISAEQKLKISESKGKFLDGKTLKIKY